MELKDWVRLIAGFMMIGVLIYGCQEDARRSLKKFDAIKNENKVELRKYAEIFCKCQGGISSINFLDEFSRTANIYCLDGSNSINTQISWIIYDRECQ